MTNQNPAIAAAVKAAMGAVTETAQATDNKLNVKAVADAKPDLVAAMTEAVAADPVVQNATNSEAHFWQKRTFWATLAAGFAALVPAVSAFLDYMNNHAVDGKTTVTTILFAAWAGYSAARAGIASKPLGA